MKTKASDQIKTKQEIIEMLHTNNISYSIAICDGCEIICIPIEEEPNGCMKSSITLQTSDKGICKVRPCEILYIAIENRKSVLYLTDRKIETNYLLDYWKKALDPSAFAQPHYSYIVNLNYVEEVTKDFVKLKYADKEYSVYTSSRKIGAFRRAVLEFGKSI